MTPPEVFQELLRLASAAGLEVRSEAFVARGAGAGGLCKLRGRWVLLINDSAPIADRLAILADALAPLEIAGEKLSTHAHQVLSRARQRRIPRTDGAARRRETEAERALRTGVHLRGIVRAAPRGPKRVPG